MSKKITVKCDQCGESIHRYRSEISNTNFCNRQCKGNWQRENLPPHLNETQFKRNEMNGEENYNWKGGLIEIGCSNCEKMLYRHPCRIKSTKNHFCNPKCKGEWQSEHCKGENAPVWKGGRYVSKSGYIMIAYPEHPRARQNGYVAEHILIAELKYGRPIPKTEHVHHLNGIKDDNCPENLVVVAPKDHDRFSIRHALQERVRELEEQLRQSGT